MKKFLFAVAATMMLLSGCYDDTALVELLDKHGDLIENLQSQCEDQNTNITTLQSLVNALQNSDYATGCTPVKEDGKLVGFTITFSKSEPVTINLGEGQPGATPVIGVKQEGDVYYWTVDGEYLKDDTGNKVQASSKDGVTPKLKVEEGYWFVSYDNGESWEKYSEATGAAGEKGDKGDKGDSMFKEVTADESYIYITLANDQKITLPLATGEAAGPTTIELTQITAGSATWAGKIAVDAGELPFAKVTVYYSDEESFNIHNANSCSATRFAEDGTFTVVADDLTPGATYNYCVVTEVKDEKFYGSIYSFKAEAGAEEPALTIEGKQWSFFWEAMGVTALIDLGATEEGTLIFAYDGSVMGMEGFIAYISGNYKHEVTDSTSGIIKFIDPMDPSGSEVVITYTGLTEKTVLVSNAAPFALENCQLTLVENNYVIDGGGSVEPEEPEEPELTLSVEGKQWSFFWEAMGVTAIIDLGATEEGILVFGVDAAAFGGEGYAAYASGNYTLEVTDATSGTIKFVDPMDPSGSEVVVTYTKLTDNTVLMSNAAPFALENCQLTLVEENVYIQPMM